MTTAIALPNDSTMRLRALLALLLFVALVSWEDAAQEQHRRMHGDDDGGAACSMHIDWAAYAGTGGNAH